ncbi:potassium-transporting ATPase KdpC subunit [Geothrix oryzae]|uniref:Potassium-transporting ATPase KdpC subunit n=1 Tax=Geothrix oryzae TaxID=2927975 RepID=A0ABN6UTG4_9BACT|nr:potassium-transporting ATPase subunit KdpC [Geothrix oryzae]BDU68034.1 potassium-transporting ATPase KdpC subunit [Geothrix oryzae]
MNLQLRPAVISFLALSLLTGIAYPLVITGLARLVFPRQAAGSLITKDGRVLGSEWIGQSFCSPGEFWGRPSATVDTAGKPLPYNAANSGASNLAPSNPALGKLVQERIAILRAADPQAADPVPVDLVTASGSGLDPHISPAAAEFQIPRVARARGLEIGKVRALVAAHTEGRQLGCLGEPRVNVLNLNLALADLR